jgi:hypothetical protein
VIAIELTGGAGGTRLGAEAMADPIVPVEIAERIVRRAGSLV